MSPVSTLISPISGIASSMTILGHTGLESPLTGLMSGLTGLISTLTGLVSAHIISVGQNPAPILVLHVQFIVVHHFYSKSDRFSNIELHFAHN